MGEFWARLSYTHISGKTLDKIYQQMAKEDIDRYVTRLNNIGKYGIYYFEEIIWFLDNYSKKMMRFADIARATHDERMFIVAYDVAQECLKEMESRYELYRRAGSVR